MKNSKYRSVLGMCIAVLIVAFCFSPQFRIIYDLPPHMRIMEGEVALVSVDFPLTLTVDPDFEQSARAESYLTQYTLSRSVFLEKLKLGTATVQFKLLGIIPIRTVQVEVLPPIKLIPGGHSIGVVLHSRGVIVVGQSPVPIANDQYVTPAKDAGIIVGDVLLKINGVPVQSDNQVAEIIDNSGREERILEIYLKRGEEQLNIRITVLVLLHITIPIIFSEEIAPSVP